MISNIIVITTYIKLGFEESINISYFALAVSDLGVTVTTCWGGITNLLFLTEARIPFNAFEISSPTVYWPSEGLEKTTTCITAYIALEKLLCVVFPLHVRKIMTRKKTAIIVGSTFLFVFGVSNISFFVYRFQWVFDTSRNETILRTFDLKEKIPAARVVEKFLDMYVSSCIHFSSLIIIWICTIFLAITLNRNVKARESNLGQGKTSISQVRNVRVIKTVLLIAGVYLVCSTPRTVCNIVSVVTTEFHTRGIYFKTYMVTVVTCVQLSLCNSSANVFIYLYMSSKFRETVQKMFCVCCPRMEAR